VYLNRSQQLIRLEVELRYNPCTRAKWCFVTCVLGVDNGSGARSFAQGNQRPRARERV
jgi:hypothetical protein